MLGQTIRASRGIKGWLNPCVKKTNVSDQEKSDRRSITSKTANGSIIFVMNASACYKTPTKTSSCGAKAYAQTRIGRLSTKEFLLSRLRL